MKRIVIWIFILLLLSLGGVLFGAKLLINTDHLKQQVEDTLSGLGSTKAVIKGEVKFELLPKPLLTFKDVSFSNITGAASSELLQIREVRAHMPWSSVLSRTPSFNDLTLISPVLELELLEDGRKNWHALTPSGATLPDVGGGLIPPVITIVDGRVTYRVQTEKTDFSQINLSLNLDSWKGPFATKGNFSYRNESINLNAEVGNLDHATDATLALSSPSFEATMKGKTHGDSTAHVSGILKMNILNLGLFTGGIFPVYSLPTHITSAETMDIEGAFTVSEEGFSLRQLSMNSESIKASAEIRATVLPASLWDIQAHVELFDLDKLTSASEDTVSVFSSPNTFNFSIPKETSLLFYLTADKIIYRKDSILNTTLDAAMANQELVIHTLEGIVPGKSDFLFTGAIEHNDIRPLLEGEIQLNGTNFNALMVWLYPDLNFIPETELRRFVFKSKVSMMPTRIRASEIRGNIDNIGVEGEFEMRPEERTPSYRFALNIDRADLNALRIPEKISSLYTQLQKDIKDPFSNSFISSLHGKYTLMLTGKNLLLNGHKIRNSSLDLALSSDRIEMRNFSVNTEESDLAVTYDSNLLSDPPTIESTVSARALNLDIFFPPNTPEERWQWDTKRFNFLGLDEFRGSFKAKVGYLKHHRLRLQNLEIDTSLKDAILTLRKATALLGGAPVIVKGQMGVGDSNSFGISYGMNGSDVKDIINIFTDDVNMRGRLYLSGKASSYGSTPITLINNMTGNLKLSAKDILVNNLGLSKLIQQAPLLKSAIDLDVLKNYTLKNGTTLFTGASGSVEFASGVASTKDLRVASQYSRGLFAANIDLRSFMTKAVSKHRFAVSKGQLLSVGLDLSGPVLAPTKELDVSEIEKFITDRAKRR